MIKKLLFVIILCLFFPNAFLAFSVLYDDEASNDIGSSSQSPVLFDTSAFGFEKLKEYIKLKAKNDKKAKIEIKKIEDQNAARLKKAITSRLQKNNEEAENLFKDGAANGCPSSMYWLGFINEENEQENQSFSWYMLSFLYYIIQSDTIEVGLNKSENILKKLNQIVEKNNFCQTRKFFYNELKNEILGLHHKHSFLIDYVRHDFVLIFQNIFCKNFPRDQKLTAFWINLIEWNTQKLKAAEAQALSQRITQMCLDRTGRLFWDYEAYQEATYCFRLSKSTKALSYLGYLIFEKKCNYDENNKLIKKKNRNKAASILLWNAETLDMLHYLAIGISKKEILFNRDGLKIAPEERYQIAAQLLWKHQKEPDVKNALGLFILNAESPIDAEGQIIPSDMRNEFAANLFRQAQTPNSKALLGSLILKNKINKDFLGNEFEEHLRFEIAAQLFRESKTPEALFNLAELISEKLIMKDLENKDIEPGQENEEAANLLRMSAIDSAYHNLAVLIAKKLIHKDLNRNSFLEENRYEVAADLFRKSNSSKSLCHISDLLINDQIKTDLRGNLITSPDQKNKALIELFKLSDEPYAKFNLAISMLLNKEITSIETKREAYKLMEIAALQGVENADIYCTELQNEIQRHENNFLKAKNHTNENDILVDESSSSDQSENDSEEVPYKHEEEPHEFETGESSLAPLSIDQRLKLKAFKKEQKKKEQKKTAQKFKNLLRGKIEQKDMDFMLAHKQNILEKSSKIIWNKNAEEDWRKHSPALKNKISGLIRDIKEGGNRGKPEALKNNKLFSRKITRKDRLIYKILDNSDIEIFQCLGHYDD
ncbi:MAG: type II toxin-antitoxin system YoeB family toxin [Alphaproteobacteria bacterium]|nr:type II toxin-antitoxin system YoeB family toxin [Alphaproteobacteria bacterium]